MFLPYLHSFRAITIVLIVAGHVVASFDWEQWGLAYVVIDKVLINCSVLFVFIGGFLFEHLSETFHYGDYLWRKFQLVVLPYLICSIPAIVYSAIINIPSDGYPFLLEYSLFERVVWFYLAGGAHLNLPLWFVPMIVLLYLAAPLFMQFKRHPELYWLLIVLVPLSMLAHRPETLAFYSGHSLEMAAYFAPAYVLGMWASARRHVIEPLLRKHLTVMILAYLAYLGVEIALEPFLGNYNGKHLFSREHGLIDWQFGQKALLCFVLMGLVLRFPASLGKRLTFIGTASFTIYFLHYYFLILFHWSWNWTEPNASLWAAMLVTTICIGACCAVAWIAQRLLGPYWSRRVVGA